MKEMVSFRVNGNEHELAVDTRRTLLQVLREDLEYIGTKEGCGTGDCGACTVLMNGRPVNACLTLAVEAVGRDIVTIEGLSEDGRLHPLQEAFVKYGAVQCGFCTPGMILSAKALLDRNNKPAEDDVRRAIAGNLCRCTGYTKIVEAIMSVAGD